MKVEKLRNIIIIAYLSFALISCGDAKSSSDKSSSITQSAVNCAQALQEQQCPSGTAPALLTNQESQVTGCEGDRCVFAVQGCYYSCQGICGEGQAMTLTVDASQSYQVKCEQTCEDKDGDGYGVGPACKIEDCDDEDPSINPGVIDWYGDGLDLNCDEPSLDGIDRDGDGDPAAEYGGTDCNDKDSSVYAGAGEIPYDGIDNDCDPTTRDGDQDNDGFTARIVGGTDCADTMPDINPGVLEIPGNNVDENCDGIAADQDDDGFDSYSNGGSDCDDTDPARSPALPEVLGNNVDENCDGKIGDVDNDGFDSVYNGGSDCNDQDPAINPLAIEIGANEVDENCDGRIGDIDGDGYDSIANGGNDCADDNPLIYPGSSGNEPSSICGFDSDGDGFVPIGQGGRDCDDTDDQINPAMVEVPYDGDDNDCNSATPDNDNDGDGSPAGQFTGGEPDCDDTNPNIRPNVADIARNGVDENCDGFDNMDGDGDGHTAIGASYGTADDCDDNDPLTHPDAVEIWYNGKDEDCDYETTVDGDKDGDHYIATILGGNDCNDDPDDPDGGASINPGVPEIPYDGIDNDCNPITVDNDQDGDGWTADSAQCIAGTVGCSDCNDLDPSINSGRGEVPFNGQDDDCDPTTLDNDQDGDGDPVSTDCDDKDPARSKYNPEIVYNNIDDDCNAATRDNDLDGDGFNNLQDCDDNNAVARPGGTEIADDGVDNDCELGDLKANEGNGVYVDGSQGCVDWGRGTMAQPNCSISYAIDIASAGEAIFVANQEVYYEDLSLQGSNIKLFGGYNPDDWSISSEYPSNSTISSINGTSLTALEQADIVVARFDIAGVSIDNSKALLLGNRISYGHNVELTYDIKMLAMGSYHICILKPDGEVVCDIGSGISFDVTPPDDSFISISAESLHSCGITETGQIKCWGDSYDQPAPSGTFEEIACGISHACAIANDGSIQCWGNTSYGQLDAPAGVFKKIDAGYYHTCAIKSDDTISCWGRDNDGQVADAPVGGTYKMISAGGNHSCAVSMTDDIECWGDDYYGQVSGDFDCGFNSYGSYLSDIIEIKTGYGITCAVGLCLDTDWQYLALGDRYVTNCWGVIYQQRHQYTLHGNERVEVDNGRICLISVLGSINCYPDYGFNVINNLKVAKLFQGIALDDDGNIVGSDAYGLREFIDSGKQFVKFVKEGGYYGNSYCGLTTDNKIICEEYQLPDTEYIDLVMGGSFVCGLKKEDGSLVCDGTLPEELLPLPEETFTQIDYGSGYRAWIYWDDSLFECVEPSSDFTAICGLRPDKSAYCWGENILNNPTGAYENINVLWFQACGTHADGTETCWGTSQHGQSTEVVIDHEKNSYRECIIEDDYKIYCRDYITWDDWMLCLSCSDYYDYIPFGNQTFSDVELVGSNICGVRKYNGQLICTDGGYSALSRGTEYLKLSNQAEVTAINNYFTDKWETKGNVQLPYNSTGVKAFGDSIINAIHNTLDISSHNESVGISLFGSEAIMINNIIYTETITSSTSVQMSNSSLELVNNNIWSEAADPNYLISDGGKYNGAYTINSCIWPGCMNGTQSNIFHDPGFADDYHLDPISECIDVGTDPIPYDPTGLSSYDIEGDGRPNGGGYDIGADEY